MTDVPSRPEPPVAISAVSIGEREEALVLEVLRSGHLAQGPMVERLEDGFAGVTGAQHAVAVSNGTTALIAALTALDVGPGDEVLTSPFTFVATLNAILATGATACFADIGPDFNMDPDVAAARVGTRTRALLPVHLYGQPADMLSLGRLANRHGLALVEDAAQAVGATVGGRPAGSYGAGCFSLYATKNLTTGEGGIVTTDDDGVADAIRVLRNQGMRQRYQYEAIGFNLRMTDLQAAVGVGQLARLDTFTAARRANAAALDELLVDVPGLVLPEVAANRSHVYHQYTVRVMPDATCTRDELAAGLAARGISSGVYYPREVHDHDCFRGHPRVLLEPTPKAARAAREVLSLPVHPRLAPTDLERVGQAVRALLTTGARRPAREGAMA